MPFDTKYDIVISNLQQGGTSLIFLSHRDLASLVEKARKGDETAFQKIYEHTANVQLFQIRQIIDDP